MTSSRGGLFFFKRGQWEKKRCSVMFCEGFTEFNTYRVYGESMFQTYLIVKLVDHVQ